MAVAIAFMWSSTQRVQHMLLGFLNGCSCEIGPRPAENYWKSRKEKRTAMYQCAIVILQFLYIY